MKFVIVALPVLLCAPSLAAQQPGCEPGSACQLARAVLEHALFERAPDRDGRALFIDAASFLKLDAVLPERVDAAALAGMFEAEHRTDVEAVELYRPGPGYSRRLRHDPWLVAVDSSFRQGADVVVHLVERYNVRRGDAIDATAAHADSRRWEYVLTLRDGVWTVRSHAPRHPPF